MLVRIAFDLENVIHSTADPWRLGPTSVSATLNFVSGHQCHPVYRPESVRRVAEHRPHGVRAAAGGFLDIFAALLDDGDDGGGGRLGAGRVVVRGKVAAVVVDGVGHPDSGVDVVVVGGRGVGQGIVVITLRRNRDRGIPSLKVALVQPFLRNHWESKRKDSLCSRNQHIFLNLNAHTFLINNSSLFMGANHIPAVHRADS